MDARELGGWGDSLASNLSVKQVRGLQRDKQNPDTTVRCGDVFS